MRWPQPGSPEEIRQFERIQSRLPGLYRRTFRDPRAPRVVVVVPSLSLDADIMARVSGAHYYEERLLCLLMLLRLPRTRVVYVTGQRIDPTIIDYYLHLLPGVPHYHALRRLTLLSCGDDSPTPLSQKILDRPRLVRRLRNAIADPGLAHMTCFTPTALERSLAVRLNVPLYACDPALAFLGTKSGSRGVFREAGVSMPDGFEGLRNAADIIEALAALKRRHPGLDRAVVKLNEGFSGEGNAVFSFAGCPAGPDAARWVRGNLPGRLTFEAPRERWTHYRAKFEAMGGIVECYLDASPRRSPSVQCRIDPLGTIDIVSTHEQCLGGPSGHVFLGCRFPADRAYRLDIQAEAEKIARVLRRRGVLGRFGVDFLTRPEGDGWQHDAIEINLRKGGTTHPFLMLQFLTDGTYDPEVGVFRTRTGQVRCYVASDNLYDRRYRGLTPRALVDLAVDQGLHFDGATQEGVVFHLIGALEEFGKLGIVSIGEHFDRARELYDEANAALKAATRRRAPSSRRARLRTAGSPRGRRARSTRRRS